MVTKNVDVVHPDAKSYVRGGRHMWLLLINNIVMRARSMPTVDGAHSRVVDSERCRRQGVAKFKEKDTKKLDFIAS
jgi:hypothetical protein